MTRNRKNPRRGVTRLIIKPSPAYANYVLGVLFIVYVFNFIDRQVLSVFIGPIKEEFGASDTQMGLLAGFAFALLYTFAGIPIARLADRGNRRNIIVIGLVVWSAMTVACGFARSFAQLALARVLVGIGEAAGSPPSHSMIADYFSMDRRATALAIYTSGAFVGSALAYLGGGYLREYFDWRTAFIVVGVPGLLIALLLAFTVREPLRGISEQRTEDKTTTTLGDTLRYLFRSRVVGIDDDRFLTRIDSQLRHPDMGLRVLRAHTPAGAYYYRQLDGVNCRYRR